MAAIRHGLKMDLNKAARLLPVAKPIGCHHRMGKAAAWQPIRSRHQSPMAGFGADPEKLEIAITSSILCKAYPKDSEGDHWSKQMHQNPITILKLGIFF